MKTHLWIPLFLFFLVVGCRDRKGIVETPQNGNPEQPEWMLNRPHSPSFYIGIGSCSKVSQPLDYQTIAKKNALNDLASEISVKVQGETFLNSLEVNKNFSEEFISTISTTTSEQIEDFEVSGIWENEKEYWIYYRLNKSDYQFKKQEKKKKAMNAAFDFYTRGMAAEAGAQIPAAMDMYFRGLFEIRDYWNEVNEYGTDSARMYLDNELYRSIQRVGSGMVIRSDAQKITLGSSNAYSAQVPVKVVYGNIPVRNITVDYRYEKARYMKPRVVLTDEVGAISAVVEEVDLLNDHPALDIRIDLEPLIPQDLDKAITLPLVKNILADRKTIPVEVIRPSFYIHSEEKMFGTPAASLVLLQSFQSQLVKQGMRVGLDAATADYQVEIRSNTTAGGVSQGFSVAFLEMSVLVRNTHSGEVVYQDSVNSVKGLQLNEAAAGIEAYKKGQERVETQVVKALMDAIF